MLDTCEISTSNISVGSQHPWRQHSKTGEWLVKRSVSVTYN